MDKYDGSPMENHPCLMTIWLVTNGAISWLMLLGEATSIGMYQIWLLVKRPDII